MGDYGVAPSLTLTHTSEVTLRILRIAVCKDGLTPNPGYWLLISHGPISHMPLLTATSDPVPYIVNSPTLIHHP